MSRDYVLITALKTRDAVAATAEHTLRHEMGYGDVLVALARMDYWRVTLTEAPVIETGTAPDPADFMAHLARSTRVFVNPNKHTWSIHGPGALASECLEPGRYRVRAVVRSRDDRHGEAAWHTLATLYKMKDRVSAVQSGVLWSLDITADTLEDARNRARDMLETRHRREGLLANPHYEAIEII